jgi:Ca2+-binding EF-hand superfamily protein
MSVYIVLCWRNHALVCKQTFQRMDVDGSGYISRANLRAVMGSTLPDSQLDR